MADNEERSLDSVIPNGNTEETPVLCARPTAACAGGSRLRRRALFVDDDRSRDRGVARPPGP